MSYKTLDKQAGSKLKKSEAKQKKLNKKRVKEWMHISGVKKKTKWTY